jgi:hypothetical protein
MINDKIHKKPVTLDREKHRKLRLKLDAADLSMTTSLNAFFLAAAEFGDACKDYPIVFVKAGTAPDGKQLVAPLAVLGVVADQNLCVDGGRWRVRYVPALLRLYPFAMARVSDTQLVVCIDESAKGFSETEGQPLFNAEGQPTEFTLTVQKQLEQFEVEVERTKLLGAKLIEKDLLRDMRFDATLPDGSKVSVDGFLTVDEEKLGKLNDADVVALSRNGLMGLIHAHQISLGNMGRLVEWHVERGGGGTPAVAAAAAAPTVQ